MTKSCILRLLLRVCILAVVATAMACATSYDKRGVFYKVRQGDTIWRIAATSRVDVQELAEYNNILSADDVQPGMRLYIPPRSKKNVFKKISFGEDAPSARNSRSSSWKKGNRDATGGKPIQLYRGTFDWPLDGRVSSAFGFRDGRRHDGIDIGADTGTPIRASAAGRVVFAGQMRGYGNLILLRHDDDFFTAYAHNSANKAKKDQNVKKGQVIALVGRTGRATAPHLHFEIRHGQTARNPLFFLPERKGVTVNAGADK